MTTAKEIDDIYKQLISLECALATKQEIKEIIKSHNLIQEINQQLKNKHRRNTRP